ncbi:MAG: PEP-CTERM sorting domain-containing protein [Gammaproteobacteria bacterium]|nr:PEP-CTERM sorting domain-containing protein [Gammaproteobacteria bacterium]
MIASLFRILALPLLLALSPGSLATYVELGELGLGSVSESGEITADDFLGMDWYTEPGSVDEARFYFDVFDFTVSRNMLLTVRVVMDPPLSDLYPYLYLFRPGNAPDLIAPESIWTEFDDKFTEIDFYVEKTPASPDGPLVTSGQGASAVLEENVTIAYPAYRFFVTGEYFAVTDGNYWFSPNGYGHTGSYNVTFTGTPNEYTRFHVPEPTSWLLLALGLLALGVLRQRSPAVSPAVVHGTPRVPPPATRR